MAQSIRRSLPHLSTTQAIGISLGQTLPAGTIILLEGDLGSGKTALVQGIGQGLGIHDAIVSPTFTLVNEYLEGRIPLYHLDLYRLQPSAVAALQPEIYWEGTEYPLGIVAIEWAERLPYRPKDYLNIRLNLAETGDRKAELSVVGAASPELSNLLTKLAVDDRQTSL
jgi:tRNA threonylcarbamoyladenosine biosynthesis protein TsaE